MTTFFGIYIANQSLVYQASLAVWLSPVCAGIGLIVAADMALSIYKAGLDAQKQQQELKEKKDAPDPAANKKDDKGLIASASTAVNPSLNLNQAKPQPNLLRRIFRLPKGRLARVSHDSSSNPLSHQHGSAQTSASEKSTEPDSLRFPSAGGKESPRRSPTLDGDDNTNNLNQEDSRFTGRDIVVDASRLSKGISGPGSSFFMASDSGPLGESSVSSNAGLPPLPTVKPSSPFGLGKSTLPPIRRKPLTGS